MLVGVEDEAEEMKEIFDLVAEDWEIGVQEVFERDMLGRAARGGLNEREGGRIMPCVGDGGGEEELNIGHFQPISRLFSSFFLKLHYLLLHIEAAHFTRMDFRTRARGPSPILDDLLVLCRNGLHLICFDYNIKGIIMFHFSVIRK